MAPITLSAILLMTIGSNSIERLTAENSFSSSQTPRQIWSTLDNGLEIAALPIVSLLPTSQQKVSVITLWAAGAHNDPLGNSGRTKLAAHMVPLCKSGDRPARSHRQWQDFHEGQAQIRAGSRHTWIIESVPPGQLLDTVKELSNRFSKLEITADDLARARQFLRSNKRSGKWGDSDRLSNKVLDRLDPLTSGPREKDDLDDISLAEMRQFLGESFQPINTRIAIVGPYDPGPLLEAVKQNLAPIAGGKKLIQPPVPVPVLGVVKPFPGEDSERGLVMRGWRVPPPGTVEALALGLFVPRAQRALQQGRGGCRWDPFLNPEVVLIHQEVYGSEPFQPKSIEEAISRIEATVEFAIYAPLEGGDFEGARKSIGIQLGAYRVHEEVSMVSPLPVAEVVLLRRVFNMDETKLQNEFGRNHMLQLQRLQEKNLTAEKAVSGTIVPTRITDGKSSIQRELR